MPDEAKIEAWDSLNRPTHRTFEITGGEAEAIALGAKVQAITALAIYATQTFTTKASYASPTAYGTTSATAKAVCFLLEIKRPNNVVEEYKDIFPCVKPTLQVGENVTITADVIAWYDNFKTTGKLRLADGSTVNKVIKGYTL